MPATEPIRIYLATGNAHKAVEIEAMLQAFGAPCRVLPAATIGGMPEVNENADSFAGNARLKAEALRPQADASAYVLADDSGLAMDDLDGAPGIHSARYAGANATDADNNALLLQNLAALPAASRRGAFVCCFYLLGPAAEAVFHGRCEGTIASAARGSHGFGYDPLFIPEGYTKTFGELGAQVKNSIGHRTQCCKALAQWLKDAAAQRH